MNIKILHKLSFKEANQGRSSILFISGANSKILFFGIILFYLSGKITSIIRTSNFVSRRRILNNNCYEYYLQQSTTQIPNATSIPFYDNYCDCVFSFKWSKLRSGSKIRGSNNTSCSQHESM